MTNTLKLKPAVWRMRTIVSPIHEEFRGTVIEAAHPNLMNVDYRKGTRSASFEKPYFIARAAVTNKKDLERFMAYMKRRGYELTEQADPIEDPTPAGTTPPARFNPPAGGRRRL